GRGVRGQSWRALVGLTFHRRPGHGRRGERGRGKDFGSCEVILLRNVSVEYRLKSERVLALRNINLDLREGSFEAIMGPSGSGKTTLIQLIAGLLTPTEGEVIVSGESLHTLNDKQISAFRNRTIGFVFQFFNLPNYYTALDNAALPLVFAGVDEPTRRTRARTLLSEFGLED